MKLTVGLRGYPEAVLATDSIAVNVPSAATASAVVRDLASRSAPLREALIHDNGTPRQSTKVLVNGAPISHSAQIDTPTSVTVLAALPCDG